MTNEVSFPDSVVVVRNVQFGTGGGRPLHMDILRPRTRRAAQEPVLVWVHGGWWRRGASWPAPGHLAALVEQDYFVCSVEYRLSDEAKFPAQIEDVKCAIRYLRAHAARYGIDPNRIGVWGASAGGHLAALAGTAGDVPQLEGSGGWQDQSSRVQAAVDWYGPTDIADGDAHAAPDSHGSLLIGGPVHENLEQAARVNPAAYISSNTPPILIMHGTEDTAVLPSQSKLLYAALQKANVPSELVMVPGKGHEALGEDALEKVHAFLARLLKPAGVH
jgi:acetyl esterase/lipase